MKQREEMTHMARENADERKKNIGEITEKLTRLDGRSLMLIKTGVDVLAARERMEAVTKEEPQLV